jgi:hypothetical protein
MFTGVVQPFTEGETGREISGTSAACARCDAPGGFEPPYLSNRRIAGNIRTAREGARQAGYELQELAVHVLCLLSRL